MALFEKKNAAAEEAPVVMDANAEAPAPEAKAKKEKKNKQQYLEPNKMNFLTQYEIVVEGKKQNLDLKKIMKPLIAVAVVVFAVFVVMEVILLGMKAQTKSLNKYINNEENVASYNEAMDTKAEIDTVNVQKSNLESCINAIKTYPTVDTTFFKNISSAGTNNGVEVTSYSYSNNIGYLQISCTSKTISGISKFIRDLVALDIFYSVEYTSFSGDSDNGYSFSVSMYCNGTGDNFLQSAPVVEETTETTEEAAE